MSKYIDAEQAIKEIGVPYNRSEHDDFVDGFNSGLESAANTIKEMPAADVVEVVRCKDCKHYQFADNRAFGMPVKMCEWLGFEDVDDDDFCSRAERKTDG